MEQARRKPQSHHPTSRVVLGQRARFWRKVHIALVKGNTGTHRGPPQWGATRPKDASVAIQAQPGDLVKMVNPPPPHTHRQVKYHLGVMFVYLKYFSGSTRSELRKKMLIIQVVECIASICI